MLVAEDVGGDDVEESEDEDEYPGADDQTPEGEAEGGYGCGFFVEVTENFDAQDEHGGAESDEAVGWAEEWPVGGKVVAEEGAFGNYEEDWEVSETWY